MSLFYYRYYKSILVFLIYWVNCHAICGNSKAALNVICNNEFGDIICLNLVYTLHFSALSLDSLLTVCAHSLKYVMILWQQIFGVSDTEAEKRTIKSEEFWRCEPRAFGFRLVLAGLQVTIISSSVHF